LENGRFESNISFWIKSKNITVQIILSLNNKIKTDWHRDSLPCMVKSHLNKSCLELSYIVQPLLFLVLSIRILFSWMLLQYAIFPEMLIPIWVLFLCGSIFDNLLCSLFKLWSIIITALFNILYCVFLFIY